MSRKKIIIGTVVLVILIVGVYAWSEFTRTVKSLGGVAPDYKMEAEVYSYSRTKGLFAGVSLNGTAIELDEQATSSFYGKGVSSASVFSGSSKSSDHAAVEALKEAVSALYQ